MSGVDPHFPQSAFQPLPPSNLNWVGPSSSLALVSSSKKMSALDEIVRTCRLVLQGHPQDRDRAVALYCYANALFSRFGGSGIVSDLDDAIRSHREALNLLLDHGDPTASLNDLAVCLYTRFKRLGVLSNLREAIDLHRKALSLRQPGHRGRPATLNNLALCLSSLFDQQGVESDLDEAIQLLYDALVLLQQDDFHESLVSLNLGDCLYTSFKHTGVDSLLYKAINFHEKALDKQENQVQLNASSSLARSLLTLFEDVSNDRAVLERAIDLGDSAIRDCQDGDPILPISLHNLGECLFARFSLSEELSDLNSAINHHHNALKLRPRGHPDRSSSLSSLAKCHLARSKHSMRSQRIDHVKAFNYYSELMDVSQAVRAVFVQDVDAARDWVRAAESTNHSTTISAYRTLFKLLLYHLATLPALTQHYPLLKRLTLSLAMDAFSACLRHDSLVDAIELLEQGRAIFLGLLSRLRSPLDEVEAYGERGRELAEKFRELASPLRHASKHDEAWDLNTQLQEVVSTIRSFPGLEGFLLPPLFSDLMRATSGGPVIILNASQYGYDAVVLLPNRDPEDPTDLDPVHIPLRWTEQEMNRELDDAVRTAATGSPKRLAAILRKLWDQITSPIVNVLQETIPLGSRIWWCPTGEFCELPLHAAGPYKRSQKNLSDLYISSFTTTLTSLIHARQQNAWACQTERKRVVAICCADVPGLDKLLFASAELDRIHFLLNDRQHVTLTRVDGEQSCIPRVIEELGRNEWVHLACHGLVNCAHPFESAFALHDGRLTIPQIIGCDVKNPEFAYLSACYTAALGDRECPDEVIHLASSMHFIGFRSVIGTLRAVADEGASKVVSVFYRHMVDESGRLDHTRAAFALNKAVKSPGIPLDLRASLVHFGA